MKHANNINISTNDVMIVISLFILLFAISNLILSIINKAKEDKIISFLNKTPLLDYKNISSSITRKVKFSQKSKLFTKSNIELFDNYIFIKTRQKRIFNIVFKPFLITINTNNTHDKNVSKYVLTNISKNENNLEIHFTKLNNKNISFTIKLTTLIEEEIELINNFIVEKL